LCTACQQPLLKGTIVLSRCNHVFHRACLDDASLVRCPKCSESLEEGKGQCLELYGVGFGDCSGRAAAKVAAERAKFASDADARQVAVEVEKICTLRDGLRRRREELEKKKAELAVTQEECDKQREKLRAVQRTAAKREAEKAKVLADLEKAKRDQVALLEQVEQIRQRDTTLDYWDILRNKTPGEALSCLTKMVGMVPEPWRILTEVARLRDHCRDLLAKRQKVAAAAKQRETRARHEHSERQRKVSELESRLERTSGSQGNGRAKRQRLQTNELHATDDRL